METKCRQEQSVNCEVLRGLPSKSMKISCFWTPSPPCHIHDHATYQYSCPLFHYPLPPPRARTSLMEAPLPSLWIDGHRPCEGRDGRDPSVEVTGDLVAEHRPQGVSDPVQPTLVNAEELCQCCCLVCQLSTN